MILRDALDRTLLLMRDEVGEVPTDEVLLQALTEVTACIVVDESNCSSHSAQTAVVTAAILMARSGHQVFVSAPNVRLLGAQPPLAAGLLIDSLLAAGRDLLPGVEIRVAEPGLCVDLAIAIGDAPVHCRAKRTIRVNAGAWAGSIGPEGDKEPWKAGAWPVGAMVAAAMAAMEVFKLSMQRLQRYALNPSRMTAQFADIRHHTTFEVAAANTRCDSNLDQIAFVSGGAITNAALYALSRLPSVKARGSVFEPDVAAMSNMNRYMLLLRSHLNIPKTATLAEMFSQGELRLFGVEEYFDTATGAKYPLPPTVLVGTDDIVARWLVQRTNPLLLVVGATTHWSAMASFHSPGLGCAQCLHKTDDPNQDLIPTMACVSFWAGLLAAVYILRSTGENLPPVNEQQIFITPSRPERAFIAPVPIWAECPTCQRKAAA